MNENDHVEADELLTQAERLEETNDLRGAFEHLLKGARRGYTACQINLGSFYSDGKGVERNSKRAAHWYKAAYRNGDSTGAFNLAIDLRNSGRERAAAIWFKKAIAMNDGSACLELAKMYLTRKSSRKAAIALLQQTTPMRLCDISEDEKEQAEGLLKQIGATSPKSGLR